MWLFYGQELHDFFFLGGCVCVERRTGEKIPLSLSLAVKQR